MAARAIGTANISFGLVSVPIKLYSTAETSSAISFNLVHRTCGTRLKQQYTCPRDEVVVPRAEMAKGYEFQKGSYVIFTPDELKAIEARSDGLIEILEFVPQGQVERMLLNKVYYLGPDKGGDRPYRLLSAALARTGRAAVGRYAARGKQYLVMIRPMGDGLVLEQLHYADEVKSFTEVPLGEAEVKEPELELAVQLIEQAATDTFSHEKHEDEVRQHVLELIQAKIDGQDITQVETEEPRGQIIDLMSALKASLKTRSEPDEVAAPESRKKKKVVGEPGS